MFARLKVILSSIVTYAVTLSMVLSIVAEELPGAAAPIARILSTLTAIVVIIRRVTPVLPEDRGILPPKA